MGTKAQRAAARAQVTAYYEEQLADLVQRVADVIDRNRTGEVDVFAVDETIHHYHNAARELWKFCWSHGSGSQMEIVVGTLALLAEDKETIDWWERTAPRGSGQ